MSKPKIRFKGFIEDWEQRKLSDCAGFRRGSFPQPYGNKDWYDGEGAMPFVQVADVSNDMKLVNDTKQKISKLAQPMSVFAEEGSVLVTLQGSIGRVAITQYGAFVDRTVLIFDKYEDGIDKRFWAYIIKEKFEDEARKAPGGTIKTITKEVLSEFDLMLPSYAEQRKLADYLISLDHLITLHQRKYEEMKKFKKCMLQKMFPQNGKNIPEIRFEGFTEDWEQRKLGDILERRVEQRQQSEEYPRLAFASGQGVIPLSERRTNNREQLIKDEFTKKYLVTEMDDIVYNPANVKYGAIDRNKCGRGLISPIYVTFTTNEISGFIERIVTSHDFQQKALRFEEGTVTKRQSVNPEDFITIDIVVAPQREEQKKISDYFDQLDHLITLHQRKYEELQKIKKFMLQNMFI